MKFKSLAMLGASLALTLGAAAAQAANPMGLAYKSTTNVLLYAKPTGLMVTGRCNAYNSVFQRVRAGGGEVLMYITPVAVPDNWTCSLDQKFFMGDAGRVPLWPYPSYGQRIMRPGTHMADLRPGSRWILWVVSYVEKIMREGKFDGVFIDTCGGRPWPKTAEWSSWPLWEKNKWTDGCVDLVRRLDAKRRAIRPNFIIVNNNIWDRSDGNTRGLVAQKYVDGIGLEHPAGLTTYFKNIVARRFGSLGHRRVFVIAHGATEARAWAKVKGVTHVSSQSGTTNAYAYPTVPPVGFTRLTDRN
jgi:hypothetical protein